MERYSPTIVRANLLVREGRAPEAISLLQRHLARQSRDHHALRLLAAAHALAGDSQRARFFALRALEVAPNDAGTCARAASVMAAIRAPSEAADLYRRALAIDPDYLDAIEGLANTLFELHDFAGARAAAERALALQPGAGPLTRLHGAIHLALGHAGEALRTVDDALAQHPDDEALLAARAMCLNYIPGADPADIAEAHRRFGRCKTETAGAPLPPAPPRSPGPLRVGLVSPDFRAHSVAYFTEPLVANLDRSRFIPIAFSTNAVRDAITDHFRPLFAEWHDLFCLNDPAAAALIRGRNIDILIDLCGLTSGERLGLFTLRPARVHATYLGYPNTTGIDAMDVRIVDAITDPPGAGGFNDRCTERLARLDGCFVCFGPIRQAAPDPKPRPENAPISFASFNTLAKVGDSVIDTWARIVTAVPGSRLLLKAEALRDESARADVRSRFQRAGLAPDRIELMGWVATDPLLFYDRVDVALDPFPYNGTTTTCEALWMGVPVVTLAGNTHAGRVGASLLTHAGLPELVAHAGDKYLSIATALASDRPRLAAYRKSLRPRLQTTIADGAAFTRRFEGLLESIAPR